MLLLLPAVLVYCCFSPLLFFSAAACRVLLFPLCHHRTQLIAQTEASHTHMLTRAELNCGWQVTVVCAVPTTPNDPRFTGEGEGTHEPDATTMYEASFW